MFFKPHFEMNDLKFFALCCFCSKLDDEIVSLVDFTPELLVHCVSKCIRLIQSDLDVPESLPPGKMIR